MLLVRATEEAISRLVERLLHRIEGIAPAREDGKGQGLAEASGKLPRLGEVHGIAPDGELPECHSVLRERPGLVHAQDRSRAEHLDRGHAPGEDVATRDAPRAEREEHGEHDRELLRQCGHRKRDAGQKSLLPCLCVAASR